jgi:5-methylcytosine-specific restriction endonuclease McrA
LAAGERGESEARAKRHDPEHNWRDRWDWRRRAREQVAREPICALCGAVEDLTADHIVPVAAGGPIDGPLRTLCNPCNGRLGAEVGRRS